MSDNTKQFPFPISVVVVFGAPTTGKTTLLKNLEKLNCRAASGGVHFVTLHEPTNDPEIVALLKQMYNETPEQIARGESVAANVQTCIMQRRASGYASFVEDFAAKVAPAVRFGKREAVVVVCDGHVLTDDKLYMQSKVDSGQVSREQQRIYEEKKSALLAQMHPKFARPDVFYELSMDDKSGATHVRRIIERNSQVESDVPASVFVTLDQYSERTRIALAAEPHAPIVRRTATDKECSALVFNNFCEFVQTELFRGTPSPPPPRDELPALGEAISAAVS